MALWQFSVFRTVGTQTARGTVVRKLGQRDYASLPLWQMPYFISPMKLKGSLRELSEFKGWHIAGLASQASTGLGL